MSCVLQGVLGMAWCPQDASLLLSSAKDNRTICWDVTTGDIVCELPESKNWNFDVQVRSLERTAGAAHGRCSRPSCAGSSTNAPNRALPRSPGSTTCQHNQPDALRRTGH